MKQIITHEEQEDAKFITKHVEGTHQNVQWDLAQEKNGLWNDPWQVVQWSILWTNPHCILKFKSKKV